MKRFTKVSTKTFKNINTPVLAIDIEGAGHYFENTTLGIGIALYVPGGFPNSGLYKLRLVPDFTNINFEDKCVTEFWDKHPDVLQAIKDSPRVTWQEISNIIDELDREFPDLLICSDNPAYDIGHINAELQLRVGVRGLSYKLNETYRNIIDTDSFLSAYDIHDSKMWVWTKKILEEYKINVTANYDHLPENDAMYILEVYLSVLDIKRNDWHPFEDDIRTHRANLQEIVLRQISLASMDNPDSDTIEKCTALVDKTMYDIAIVSLADAIFTKNTDEIADQSVVLHVARTRYQEYDYSNIDDADQEDAIRTLMYFGVQLKDIPIVPHDSDLYMLHALLREYIH